MKKLLFCNAVALTVLMAGVAKPFAQTQIGQQPEDLRSVFDEIIVTATKKNDVETVQDVPLAVTAFNEATLETLKVRDIESLSFYAPNVSLDQIDTSRGTANFSIRGLGINSSITSIDPTVGVFIDGVYFATPRNAVLDLFDIESIEILRGPQGLLFGRNTTGGAVLINTTRPSDVLKIKARLAADRPARSGRGGDNITSQLVLSGPLSADLRGKLSLYSNEDDGYFKNLYDNSNHGAAQALAVRLALEWDASDVLLLAAKIEYFDVEGDGPAGQNHGHYSRDSFDFAIDEKGGYAGETLSFSLRGDLDVGFGNGTITNIFGYRQADDGTTLGDIDSLPLLIFNSQTLNNNRQISDELRYAGSFADFDITVGLFWLDQEIEYEGIRYFRNNARAHGGGIQDHQVQSLFGQLDYQLSDKLTGILGLRYTKEEKDVAVNYILRGDTPCSVIRQTCTYNNYRTDGFTDSNEWDNVTPKIGFEVDIDPNRRLYGHYVRGFRSGGYNVRITNLAGFLVDVNRTGNLGFDEEQVDNVELGYKHQTPDGRGQLNMAIFRTEISDMQREVNLPSSSAGVAQSILNTADATIDGLEAELAYFVTDQLRLTANIGLLDGQYDRLKYDISSDGVVNATDFTLDIPRLPAQTYGLGLNWLVPLAQGDVTVTAHYQHRDKAAYTDNNFGWLNAQDMLDMNVAYAPNEQVKISLYGRNLLDEVQFGNDTQLSFGAGALSNGVNRPYDPAPKAGTFSPLKKGAIIGLELVWHY